MADHRDEVFELDNSNNARGAGTPIDVVLSAPDLAVTAIAADASARAGSSLTVAWTVMNQGVGASIATVWTDTVFASTDGAIGGDTALGSFTRYGRLNANESYDRIVSVPVPFNLDGPVNIYVRTDNHNVVAEFDGDFTNESAFVPVQVARETADLQVIATDFSAENGRLRLGWQVENVGSNRTNSTHWRDAVYMSRDDTLDASDLRLSSVYHGGALAPGQHRAVSRVFDVPYDLNDSFHFFVVTDDTQAVDESGMEANNIALLGQIDTNTLRTFPDLVVHQVDAPGEVVSGQFFDVTWTVRNLGDAMVGAVIPPPEYAAGSWYDSVYISRDQVFDAGHDYFLGSVTTTLAQWVDVADGGETVQEYRRTASFRVPDGLTGPLYVLVVADRGDRVVEIDAEQNNREFDGESMFASLAEVADLSIGVVTVPADAALGSSVALSYSLEVKLAQALGNFELFAATVSSPGWLDIVLTEPEKHEDHVSSFDIPLTSCSECAETRILAGGAAAGQLAAFLDWGQLHEQVEAQGPIVAGLLVSEVLVIAGSIAAVYLAGAGILQAFAGISSAAAAQIFLKT